MSGVVLEARGVSLTYMISAGVLRGKRPLHAVNGVDLAVERGEVLGLVGEMTGCHFQERCAYATADCARGPVALRAAAASGHAYRCLLSAEQCAQNAKRPALELRVPA